MNLPEEGAKVAPAVAELRAAHDRGLLDPASFAAFYVLVWSAVRFPRGFLSGRRNATLSVKEDKDMGWSWEGLETVRTLLDEAYLARKKAFSLWQTVSELNVKCVAPFVGEALVGWRAGTARGILLFRVPTPMEVLEQQARGERVVTAFVTLPELCVSHRNMLSYMEHGDKDHERDPLDFLVHDLRHLHHFFSVESHAEQVGFFRAMVGLEPSPQEFFQQRFPRSDEVLWEQLEYVISDMNCFSAHLFKYLLAKMTLAATRDPDVDLEAVWSEVCLAFGMTKDGRELVAATRMIASQSEMKLDEWEMIRDFFKGNRQ